MIGLVPSTHEPMKSWDKGQRHPSRSELTNSILLAPHSPSRIFLFQALIARLPTSIHAPLTRLEGQQGKQHLRCSGLVPVVMLLKSRLPVVIRVRKYGKERHDMRQDCQTALKLTPDLETKGQCGLYVD